MAIGLAALTAIAGPGVFNHLGFGAGIGTSGITIEAATPIINFVNLRAGESWMPSITFNADDDYKIPADKDGNISGGFKVKNFRPYLGIGWGRMIPGKIVNFSTELGVQFEGTPELYTDYGEIDESITEDDNTFNKVANALKVYPTLTFRINFKAF